MMIESNYEINVAKEFKPGFYEHYCRIELGFMLPRTLKLKFNEIQEKFPSPEFHLELHYVECHAKTIKKNYETEDL